MGIPYTLQQNCIPVICILGYRVWQNDRSNTWNRKKTQKTPVKDIAKAEALRKAYFKSKADEQDENDPLREGSR